MNGKKGTLVQKTVQALREGNVDFYYFEDCAVLYTRGGGVLKRMPVYPSQIKTEIRFQDHGLLLEAVYPLRLNESALGKKRILEKVAAFNNGRNEGGLVYLPDSQELRFRLYYAVEDPDRDFSKQTLMDFLGKIPFRLSEGYDSVLHDGDAKLREMEELLHIQEMLREVVEYIKAHDYKLPAWLHAMDSEDADDSIPETDDDEW